MAGKGSRLQPLPFSKELYPVVSKGQHFAISEFSVRAMARAGVDEIKLVINPNKFDVAQYYSKYSRANLAMYFFDSPSLPESCLFPVGSMADEDICVFGLPDTLFTPNTGYRQILKKLMGGIDLCLGLFHVEDGSKYDSVKLTEEGKVRGVLVKQTPPLSDWVWGIWGANVKTLRLLKKSIDRQNPINHGEKLLGKGFEVIRKRKDLKVEGIKLGKNYFDVGTIDAVVRVNQIVENFEF